MMIILQIRGQITFGGDFGYSVFDPKLDHLDDKISYRRSIRDSIRLRGRWVLRCGWVVLEMWPKPIIVTDFI